MTNVLGLMTCYNRKQNTISSVNSLINGNKSVEFEFIVTDDNSTDGTQQELEKIPNVEVIPGSGLLFYSGGMRLAIDVAKKRGKEYDFCLLFNDDVAFFGSAIEKMSKYKFGTIVVGPTCDDDGKLSYGGVIKKSRFRPAVQIIDWTSSRAMQCDTFNANCVLIPWNIFMDLDNIDPHYSHSAGDYDYGFRAAEKGYGIAVFNEFVGVCCDNPIQGSWTDTALPRKKRLELKESPKGLPWKEWFYYLNKNYNCITAIIYTLIPYLRIMCRK